MITNGEVADLYTDKYQENIRAKMIPPELQLGVIGRLSLTSSRA